MVTSLLAQSRVLVLVAHLTALLGHGVLVGLMFQSGLHSFQHDPYLCRVGPCEHQLIVVYAHLHGVAHGSELLYAQCRAGYHAHVQEVLACASLPSYGGDDCLLSCCQFV